jgi:hypothetical protein
MSVNWPEAIMEPLPHIPIRRRGSVTDIWRTIELTSIYDKDIHYKFPDDLDPPELKTQIAYLATDCENGTFLITGSDLDDKLIFMFEVDFHSIVLKFAR